MTDAWVVGSINMDLVMRADHFPSPGETVQGSELVLVPGGKGANQAVAMARLGSQVSMVGRVGADSFGETLRGGLFEQGVGAEHVRLIEGVSTGVAMIVVDAHGQNSIVLSPGANGTVCESDLEPVVNQWKPGQFLVLQLEIPIGVVSRAARQAKRRGLHVILNAAPGQPAACGMLGDVDYLVVNESEAKILAGAPITSIATAGEAAQSLVGLGPLHVVLTMGEDGAIIAVKGHVTHVPAPKVEVVDTTAAGDAFIGGLVVALRNGKTSEQAVRFGCCAGAVAVGRLGAQPSLPTYEEVARIYESDRSD